MYANTAASQDQKPQVQNELKRKREDSSEDGSVPKKENMLQGWQNKNPTENPSKVGTVTIQSCLHV